MLPRDAHRSLRRDPWTWVGLACAIAFVVLATLVVRRGGLAFDEPFSAWLRGLPVPAWFWEACTFLGGAILIAIGIAMGLVALVSRRYRLVLIIAVVLIGSALLTDAVKDLVMRQRPPDPITGTNGYSFPSGHTLNSTATYGLLAVIAWRSRLSLGIRRVAVRSGSSSRSSSACRASRSAPTGPPTCSPAGWPAPRSWRSAPCSSA